MQVPNLMFGPDFQLDQICIPPTKPNLQIHKEYFKLLSSAKSAQQDFKHTGFLTNCSLSGVVRGSKFRGNSQSRRPVQDHQGHKTRKEA